MAERAPKPAPEPPPFRIGEIINDEAIRSRLLAAGEALIASGKALDTAKLLANQGVNACQFKRPAPRSQPISSRELVRISRAGVVVLGALRKCEVCPKAHLYTSSGFVVSSSGACATCYHVAGDKENLALVAMTGDGTIHAVTRLLASNPKQDVALVQLAGTGFTPLPLAPPVPAGSHVRILSHPHNRYYTLTEGVVSRHFATQEEGSSALTSMFAVTAEFGPGASGGPVFDERGAVVGMVDSVESSTPKEGAEKVTPRMVFKHCRPSQALLDLFRPLAQRPT
jgi:S1-C subfamily serine protease